MPLYLIERSFAEQLNLQSDDINEIQKVNQELSVEWLYSFLTADKHKTYCLYQASNPDTLFDAARRLNIPADKIVEVAKVAPQ